MGRTALQRISDFGENASLSLCREGTFRELLKGHLAVSLRTQTSAFGRMRELPSEAVRENTDRQSSSLGCKIRQNIHPKTDRNDAKSCHNDATSCHVIEK